ncbi:zinc finger protein 1035 [Gadus morhua]|uniref:zinc finger protein 1035 n=1 Tax=Gadus morhua TaxID=8049 RepID=UPI0011B3857E|nr:uncharacterized protein LOC115554353 [Gadus morhua]XP_030226902.1 uncharacterized protein LOC115554353 [Gadus morhua]
MSHGWDSYLPNLQPPPSIPRPCELSSGPEGDLTQPIENFNAHHDLSNMEASEEAVSTNSDFGSNLYPNSGTNSDCAFSYYSDTPWQADQHQSVEDGSSKCENGDFSNLTADGLTTSSHFPSFAADLREIKEDCEILAPSFLEDYSDVSSCSDSNINETEIRPSCKYMKSLDKKKASCDNLITTKHSPSEWPFTPTGNMSISADFPTAQISETPLILPIPSELHDKARKMADCAEQNMETKEDNSECCVPKHSTSASAKSLETENDKQENAGTEQKLKYDMEEKTVPIQAKELNVTIGIHKDMAEDTTNGSSEYEKELTCPKVDKWQEKEPLVYNKLTSVLSSAKDLDVKIQETATKLSDLIQDNREVWDGEETIDQNHVSSPSLHENGMDDTSNSLLSSTTECDVDANVSHSQDTIHELDNDNSETLKEVKMTNGLKRTIQGISQFQCPAQLSSESCMDIIGSDNVEDSKCDTMDASYNQTLSGSRRLLEQPPESESTDQLRQPKLYSIMDEEKTLKSIVSATQRHEENGSESLKESFPETRPSFEQPDLGMYDGEALPRVNTPCADNETSQSEQKSPVACLENSNPTDLKVELPELKSSLQLQKRLQPIIILKTLEPVNGIKEYQCTECQHSTQNVDDIIEHHHTHSQHEFKFCPTSNIYLLHDDPQSKLVCDVTGYDLPAKVVLKTTRKKNKIYPCNSCSHVSHRFYQHVQHIRTHTGRTPFKCNGCNLYFSQSSCLYRHVRIAGRCQGSKHKSNTNLNIPKSKTTKPEQVTEKVMEFKGLTDCYVKLVDISVAHVCPFCSKTFASSKKMNKHVSNVHKVKGVIKGMAKSGVDEFGKYKCPLCPRVFKYSYNRARHLRRCIKEQTNGANWKIGSKYQCPLCKEIFSLTNNRTRHIQNNCLRSYLRKLAKANPKISLANKEVPSTTTDPEDIRGYKCSLCPARFFHPSGKYKHMKKHELYKLTGKVVQYRSFPVSIDRKYLSSKKSVKITDTSISNEANHSYGFSCSFCGKGFSKSLSLKNHERIHKGDRPFLCLECGKGFARRSHLINHKTIHQRRIQCTVCKKILPSIGELIQHRKTHLKRGKLKCPYCPLLFDYPVYLLRHLASHKSESEKALGYTEKKVKPPQSLHKQKVSQCSLCKEDFEDPQSLRKHCLKHITESSFKCPFCQHHFNSRRCLVRHIERHSGDKPFPCNDCGKRFHRIINLDLHKKTCSASKLEENQPEVVEVLEKPVENSRKLLYCSYCPRTFSRRNRFKKHHNGHKLNTLLSCSKCTLFYGRTKLSQHEKNCNGTTAIDELAKSLPNKVVEKVGKKLHGTNRTRTKTFPHTCPHCPQKFQYRSLLLRHLNSHTKKSFACDHCGRQYGNKSMCIKHEALCGGFVRKDDTKLHNYNQPRLLRPTSVKEAKEKNTDSEAEYKCKFCTKTFWKARNLRRHILTHTEVKPYRCKACDSCFSRYDHLKLHQTRCKGKRQRLEVCLPKISLDAVGKGWQKQAHSLIIAEEQRFECNICLKFFTCKSKLARHMSMLHNKSTLPINRRKNIALSTGIDRLEAEILEQYPIKRQRNACIYCPRSFKSGWQLGVHTRLHTGEKPFLCNLCGERFIRRDYLMRHSSKCNPTKGRHDDLVPCNQCQELLPKESLEIHQLDCSNASISGDLQKSSEITSNGFSCAYCDSTFLIFSQLQQHFLNDHKQDTVKSPVPTTSLQQHLSNIVSIKEEPLDATNDEKLINGDGKILFSGNTHVDDAGEKPFPCSFCNLRFKNRSGLGGHLRIHSNPAPFSCPRCMKCFWNKNHQRRHLKKCKRLEVLSKKNVGLKSLLAISSEIDAPQNDSVLVFKEGSKIPRRGTGVLQTEFSCKDPEGLQEEDQVQTSSVEKKAVHYQCSECNQSFTDGLLLISHLEDHGRVEQEKNRNTCPECGKVCNNGANLDRHMKAHGIDKTYPCLECSKRFPTLGKLLVHKKHHKKRSRPFLCKICSQRFWSNKSLLGHFSENHPKELYFCKLCSRHYTLKGSLIRHYKKRHRIRQLDQYIDCSENEESIDHGSIEVNASGGSDKDGKTDEDGDGEDYSEGSDSDAAPYFPCHVCGKTFLTSENLEDHQRCHLGEKPHECAECGKCFFQASQLLQHQRTHTSEFQCQTCHRGFVSLFALRKHKHTHGKSRPFRCSKCDLSFTGYSQLAEHMAMHREDNFPCDICNRTFSCKSSRAEHRKSHSVASGDLPPLIFEEEVDNLTLAPFTSQQNYRCGVCHQCFEDPKELSEHGCLAAKERPFSCSVCDLYFLHESHLEKHKISNHQRPSYEYLCNQCHICFSNEKTFIFHSRKHHREKRHALKIKEEDVVENSTVPKTVTEYQVCNTKNTDLVGEQNPPPINYLTHECKICKCTLPTESKMKEHERCHISADTQFECTGCGQNFLGTDAFRQHPCSRSLLKSDHSSEQTKKSPVSGPTLGEEEEVDVTGEDVFNCFACSEQFSTKSSLLEHQNDHHPKVQLKCGICGQTFKHRQDLIQHERTHLERDARATVKKKKKTRLSCFKCPTMFDTVQEMALHMKSHCVQDYLHYRCDMCYRSFSQLSLLKQHHESHVGQVVYECTECDKAFAFLHLLEEHQLTHAGPSK